MSSFKRSASMSPDDEDLKPILESDDDVKPSITKRGRSSSEKQPVTKWTSEEYKLIFEHVLEHGPRKFEGVVPGRNAKQIAMTWT
jgi:hypothetical protein